MIEGKALYVDGENHFMRSLDCWKALKGNHVGIDSIVAVDDHTGYARSPLPTITAGQRMLVHEKAQFYWDCGFLARHYEISNMACLHFAVYFTSMTGGDSDIHDAKVYIRSAGFEPQIIDERKQLRKHRQEEASKTGTLKSAKGVDIQMSVRILEDAYRGNFDYCLIATSDTDFIPVIEALRRMGKYVCVLGYRDGIGKRSAFQYVPDKFVDLGEYMAVPTSYNLDPTKAIVPTTQRIGSYCIADMATKALTVDLNKNDKKSVNRVKAIMHELNSEFSGMSNGPVIAGSVIAIDAGKVAASAALANAVENAIDQFLAAPKELS